MQATNAAGGREWHETARKVEDLGVVRGAAGKRYSRLEIESSPYFTAVTDGPEGALTHVAASSGIPVDVLREHPNVMIGSSETVVETLYSRRESLGVSYATVQQSQIESFAPVVDRLHGR